MAEKAKKEFAPYTASANEEYMNKKQLAHFTQILNDWKKELSEDIDRTYGNSPYYFYNKIDEQH